jgi:hypothetical protein
MGRRKAPPAEADRQAALARADYLLWNIGKNSRQAAQAEAELAARIEALRAECGPGIASLHAALAADEKELSALGRTGGLFAPGEDKLALRNGAVLRHVVERARRVKAMLARLKAAGMTALIKVAEAPDWDKVDDLPDAALAALGSKRVREIKISWEVNADG